MKKFTTVTILSVVLMLVVGSALLANFTVFAAANPTVVDSKGSRPIFIATLAGSSPNKTIAKVPSGGVPWTDPSGRVEIFRNGTLYVNFRSLLITGTGTSLDGTTGPVKQVLASLVCGVRVFSSTGSVKLSSSGDARIKQKISLPETCFGPRVLIRVSGATSEPWIAATGFSTS